MIDMKRFFYRNTVLLLLLAAVLQSRAERGDTLINPYFEMMHIAGHLTNGNFYTAQLLGRLDDVDTAGSHQYDSLKTTYTIQGEQYQSITDSLELVQDSLYNVTVNNIDSIIVIAPPRHIYTVLLQGDVFDETFQQNYLDSMTVRDDSLIRNIVMTFKLSSPWYSYLYAYDSAVDFIAVKYKQRHTIPLTPSGSYTITDPSNDYAELIMNIYISIPSTPPVNPFNTGKYFYRSGNSYIPQAAYTGYQIINQLPNQ